MTDQPLPLEGPHWPFALSVYARPGVAEACLFLQDTDGLDVNVLLVSLHAALALGLTIDDAELALADAQVRPFREAVVLPLRAVRRTLKEGPPPAPQAATEQLRTKIKRAELEAEQIVQAELARHFAQRPKLSPSSFDAHRVTTAVVDFYRSQCGRRDSLEDRSRRDLAIAAIAQAAATTSPHA